MRVLFGTGLNFCRFLDDAVDVSGLGGEDVAVRQLDALS
jgi:hypothetical protein